MTVILPRISPTTQSDKAALCYCTADQKLVLSCYAVIEIFLLLSRTGHVFSPVLCGMFSNQALSHIVSGVPCCRQLTFYADILILKWCIYHGEYLHLSKHQASSDIWFFIYALPSRRWYFFLVGKRKRDVHWWSHTCFDSRRSNETSKNYFIDRHWFKFNSVCNAYMRLLAGEDLIW